MLRQIVLTCIIAVSFFVFFCLNQIIFESLMINDLISWIFLPAGLRLFFVVVYRWAALPGLFLGSLAAALMTHPNDGLVFPALLAGASSLNPLIALIVVEKTSRYFSVTLESINLRAIISLAIVQAWCCSILHHLIFITFGYTDVHLLHGLLTMFLGDLIGITVMMLTLVSIFTLILQIYRKSNH